MLLAGNGQGVAVRYLGGTCGLLGVSCGSAEVPWRDANEALEVTGELTLVRKAGVRGRSLEEATTAEASLHEDWFPGEKCEEQAAHTVYRKPLRKPISILCGNRRPSWQVVSRLVNMGDGCSGHTQGNRDRKSPPGWNRTHGLRPLPENA